MATYNRCESLRHVLNGLLGQENASDINYEIIVVDNNSTDKTKEIIESFKLGFDEKLEYFFEANQGKSFALNKGIAKSKGDIIAFIDDDVLLDEGWISSVVRSSKEYRWDAMGGRILPRYPAGTPRWIKDNKDLLAGPIALYDYGEDVKRYRGFMAPFAGANMAVKKTLFDEVGLFKTNLGPGRGTFSEDTELFERLKDAHKNLYYCGETLVWHPVDRKRMNLRYIAKWNIVHGRYYTMREMAEKGDDLVVHSKMLCYLIATNIFKVLRLILNIFNRRIFLVYWNGFFCQWGMLVEYWRSFERKRRRF